ncbi:hypothetical protein ABHF54_07945 [Nitrosomonas europaea]|uniref:hypothetical protein n=1 Tax=Nitrosomonas europaea TaxID=915 RepID=UPI0032641D34
MTKTLDVSIVLGPPPSRKQPITLEQLTALAARRADVEVRTAETGTKVKKDLVVVDPTGTAPGELLFFDGRLQIRDPADATLRWMLVLAQELGGRVRDNTGKTYRSPDEKYVHPDDEEARKRLAVSIREARKIDQAPSKPKRRWFSLWADKDGSKKK